MVKACHPGAKKKSYRLKKEKRLTDSVNPRGEKKPVYMKMYTKTMFKIIGLH